MITVNDEVLIAKVKAHLANNDADQAYAVFVPLMKDRVIAVGYRIIGRTGYQMTKKGYLALLREMLPLMTARACEEAQFRKDLDLLAHRHREHVEALANRNDRLENGTITADSTAFISWNADGIQMHLADCVRDYENRFVSLATSGRFPVPESILREYPELAALIQPVAA